MSPEEKAETEVYFTLWVYFKIETRFQLDWWRFGSDTEGNWTAVV